MKTSRKRKKIFIKCVEKYKDIKYKIFEGDHKLEGGINAVREMVKSEDMPTAILCSNDFSASGALRELVRIGYKIPEDISIIGIDNSNLLCTLAVPTLTSIDIYRYDTGTLAFEMLITRINNRDSPIQRKIIKTKLVIRESVTKAIQIDRTLDIVEKPLKIICSTKNY